MAMEVSCGSCSGRLLVETPGVIVACPHCGIHLSIPELESATPPDPAPSPPQNSSVSPDPASPQIPLTPVEESPMSADPAPRDLSRAETIVFTGTPAPVPKSPQFDVSPSSIFHSAEDESPVPASVENVGWASSPNLSLADALVPAQEHLESTTASADVASNEAVLISSPETAPLSTSLESVEEAPVPAIEIAAQPAVDQVEQGISFPQNESWSVPAVVENAAPAFGGFADFGVSQTEDAGVATTVNSLTDTLPAGGSLSDLAPAEDVVVTAVEHPIDDSVSRLTFILMILGSYASLATIILIYQFLFGRAHQLESLPDLKTIQQLGGRAAVPRADNILPPGHDLRFGQSQRYGNLLVTPLRVTRGPISFEHQSGDKSEQRTPSEPVLKLWLKFENVSAKEAITPLDTTLMFFRRVLDHRVASYNVIFRQEDRKKKNPQLWYPFDRMAADTEWLIVGQHTNEALAAHASFETFVPSEEEFDGLTGELVWRVHFRKGYGPRTGNGVTTLIDVHFNSAEIKPDAS